MEKSDNIPLIDALQKGDTAAYLEIYDLYYKDLCLVAYKVIKNTCTAEDIVQNTMCKFWEKRSELNIPVHIKQYLSKAVYNNAINYYKHEKFSYEYALTLQGNDTDEHTPEQEIVNAELLESIDAAIELLPQQTKKIFKLNRLEDKKYKEIAEMLDLSVKSIEYYMSKALKAIKESLKDQILLSVIIAIQTTVL